MGYYDTRPYMGYEISIAWPSAALLQGATRPDYEKWEAHDGAGHSLAARTLAEIKAGIRAARAHQQEKAAAEAA